MWRWRREHVFAWAICAAAILCPRALWDRVRLSLVARADAWGGDAGGGAPGRDGGSDLARVRAALLAREGEIAALELRLRQLRALSRAAAVPAATALPVRVFGAEAAAGGASARAGRVRLDAGTRAGARARMPLVQGAAIAGRLVAASEGASEAELLTAATFRARCVNVRTGVDGIARGTGEALLAFAPDPDRGPVHDRSTVNGRSFADSSEHAVAKGDAIVTSPNSTFAPGGLAVGRVVSIERDPETGLVEARIEPAADLANLDRAIVLLTDGGSER